MPINISEVSLTWHDERRGQEEYNPPMRKAEVRLYARIPEGEDGTIALNYLDLVARAKVKDMLSGVAPSADTAVGAVLEAGAGATADPPARRTRGPNKPKDQTGAEPAAGGPAPTQAQPDAAPEAEEDDWSAGEADIVVTDQEILSATSKRAGELGARDPIVKLIASFATRTEGAPFKVQEIPQAQRKDYLTKLAALTA